VLKGKAIEVVRNEDITVIDQVNTMTEPPIRPATPPQLSHKRSHSIMVDRTHEKRCHDLARYDKPIYYWFRILHHNVAELQVFLGDP
jgi:hypothetical protein